MPEERKHKKRGPPKGSGGRPRIEVDWKLVESLCRFHSPACEIADHLSMTMDTLDRRAQEAHGKTFAQYVSEKQNGWGKIRLRQLQWKAAESGNVSMLIWLGKQYLGQSDKQDIETNTTGPLVIVKGGAS